jgi:hypothetical protein
MATATTNLVYGRHVDGRISIDLLKVGPERPRERAERAACDQLTGRAMDAKPTCGRANPEDGLQQNEVDSLALGEGETPALERTVRFDDGAARKTPGGNGDILKQPL